jgi:hypothetical protein
MEGCEAFAGAGMARPLRRHSREGGNPGGPTPERKKYRRKHEANYSVAHCNQLSADLGAAWIPAFAGMTARSALRVGFWQALNDCPRTAMRLRGDDEVEGGARQLTVNITHNP